MLWHFLFIGPVCLIGPMQTSFYSNFKKVLVVFLVFL